MFGRKLRIVKTDNPNKVPKILRHKAKMIKKITPAIKKLVQNMIPLMQEADGVGLAAPQVGKSLRLFIINSENGPTAIINPELISWSRDSETMQEGCLSFPGFWGFLERPIRVTIKGKNLDGEEIEISGTDLLARALCHEIDHLNGVVFLDKIKPPYKLERHEAEKE